MIPARRRGVPDLAIAAGAAFAFGCTILFNRAVARDGLPASVALGIRFAVAGFILLGVLAVARRPLFPPRGERAVAIGLGLILYAAESTCFYLGLERGTAAAVALIFYAYPAVVAVVEVLLGRANMSGGIVGALALAIGGSVTVALGGGEVTITTAGALWVCGSIALFSTYVLVSDRLLERTDALTAATWSALGASAGVLISGVVRTELEMPGGEAFASLIANGIATAVAFTLWFVVLGRIGPTRTAIIMALEAVTGIVLAAIFLDESVRALVVIGGAAVLAGAIIAALATPKDFEVAVGDPP